MDGTLWFIIEFAFVADRPSGIRPRGLAAGRLDSASVRLPDPQLFFYAYDADGRGATTALKP